MTNAMPPVTPATVVLLPWQQASTLVAPIRREVFIREQRIPEAEEWDDVDGIALHAVVRAPSGDVVGTGRVWADPAQPAQAWIGRLAMLPACRGQGWGRMAMQAMMQQARALGCLRVGLHAQTHAQAFYERLGFVPEGDVFDEVGIDHILMQAPLA